MPRGLLAPEDRRELLVPGLLAPKQNEVRNIRFPWLYDASRYVQKNPGLDFLFGGLADYAQGLSTRQPASVGGSLMAALDTPGPGTFLKGGKVGMEALGGLLGMVKAYHGSPHKFEKFALDKIGSGEGAQAYGHGLYFAENPQVADIYRQTLADAKGARLYDGKPSREVLTDTQQAAITRVEAIMKNGGSLDDAKKYAQRYFYELAERFPEKKSQYQQIISDIENVDMGKVSYDEGKLYNVELDVNKDDLLDWDKPLSEQSESVRENVKAALSDDYAKIADLFDNMTGKDVYRMFDAGGNGEKTSKWFNKHGIPGIKYLDSGSRSKGGTHNIVMFDDSKIKIVDEQ